MKSRKELYSKRKKRFDQLIQRQSKFISCISNLRLGVFIAGVACGITFYVMKLFIMAAAGLMLATILFVYLVVRHDRLIENKGRTLAVFKINENSLQRLNGEWTGFLDDGVEFKEDNHPYSQDLDIFGHGSLFQWINTAKTHTGIRLFQKALTKPLESAAQIKKQQQGVEELAEKLGWRQRFQAEGLLIAGKMIDPQNLIQWAAQRNELFHKTWVILSLRILPIITASFLVISLATGKVSIIISIFGLIVQLILLKSKSKERYKGFDLAGKYKEDVKVYGKMLEMLEKQHFTSAYLTEVKKSMCNEKQASASKQIDQLSKIIEAMSNRYNGFFIIINILTLWDYQNLIALEKWKRQSYESLKAWFEAIGQVEALSSFAIIRFDHPKWVMPEIMEGQATFEAKDLGHPLLPETRVNNDLFFYKPTSVLLITGSNMSGKSTLLRTVGVNLVLAYAGAPVCAKSFSVSLMKLYSCMRVSDNLEKNVSSFYAELLRIKSIVEAAREGQKVFFLMDEIFKGTNSRDRHTGAKVLIKNLYRTNAIGLVSTHDLELCSMEEENNCIKNYHYREYFKQNEIFFDYKLRPGASTTRNAIYLMKLAGIDMEEV